MAAGQELNNSAGIRASLALSLFLVMEGLLRRIVSPDPWLLDSGHAYFDQPQRLWMDLAFVGAALFAFIALGGLKLIVHGISRSQREYLFYGVLGAAGFFAFWERESLAAILDQGFLAATPAWLATGFLIGVGQEITFRGLLYGGLRKHIGVVAAAILTTLIFVIAPIHSLRLFDYWQSGAADAVMILTLLYVAFGAVFMWLRIATGSVLIPAIVHGVGNAITWAATFTIIAAS